MGHATSFTSKAVDAPVVLNWEDLQLHVSHATREPKHVDLRTRFSTHIPLAVPFVASPMDTVTERRTAIAMARRGAIGVIHRNNSVEEEVAEVAAVKRAESFIIRDVRTVDSGTKLSVAMGMMEGTGISGLPVLSDGRVIGIITKRDTWGVDRSASDLTVDQVMTRDVATAREGITEDEARKLLHEHKVEKLPIVDQDGKLVGLVTRKDIDLREGYKDAARDSQGRLVVAAAVGPYDVERARRVLRAGADAIVIDVAHFDNENLVVPARKIVDEAAGRDVVVGNLGDYDAVTNIVRRIDGVAGLRMGIGSGSICKTTEVTGAGSPTPFAVAQAADALHDNGLAIPVIADGGIRGPREISLAFALGASTAMMGHVFAGCEECPTQVFEMDGGRYKMYWGMGSRQARERRMVVDRYADSGGKGIEEGIATVVPYKGPIDGVVSQLIDGVRASLGYAGASSIDEMHSAKIDRVVSRPTKSTPKNPSGR